MKLINKILFKKKYLFILHIQKNVHDKFLQHIMVYVILSIKVSADRGSDGLTSTINEDTDVESSWTNDGERS